VHEQRTAETGVHATERAFVVFELTVERVGQRRVRGKEDRLARAANDFESRMFA